MARLAIVITLVAVLAYGFIIIRNEIINGNSNNLRRVFEAGLYVLVVTALTVSALAYLVARLGHLYRTRGHHRIPRAELDRHFASSTSTMTVLVPSYKEEPRVVRQTLLSAALQEYPYLRLVLLVDDPPNPTAPHDVELLAAARRLPAEIEAILAEPYRAAAADLDVLEMRLQKADPTVDDMILVAEALRRGADWLTDFSAEFLEGDHTEVFFAEHVLLKTAADLRATGEAVDAARERDVVLPGERLLELMQRVTWIFRAEVTSFERKQFVSLSPEPNKAMNLNSYLGLMGGEYRIEMTAEGKTLVPAGRERADIVVPAPDFVLTLDADSVLLPEYCLRLVHLLEQPQNARVAVIQTPYSSFPGSPTRLERIAGATTDLQHIVHQGMAYYDAAFWVGANAVIRRAALDDIVQVDVVDGRVERRYVCDRTVIEDTESSIELGLHGWTLQNYPERLSYSATPPDFGSLVVQRQRWANGGLIIVPKLIAHLKARKHRGERGRLAEGFLRMNYLASITWSSIGLILLLAYPFDDRLLSGLVVASALPYFLMMASDLKACGYKRTDVFRIYGINLLLLPVNMSGVIKSIGQAMTGRKIAFARTPKVKERTTAPFSMVFLPYVLVALSAVVLVRDIQMGYWAHAVFAALNAFTCLYAIVAFVGVRNSIVDMWFNVTKHFYRSERAPKQRASRPNREAVAVEPEPVSDDWMTVLYYGSNIDPRRVATRADEGVSVPQSMRQRNVPAVPASMAPTAGEVSDVSGALARVLADHLAAHGGTAKVELQVDGGRLEMVIDTERT